MVLAAGPQAVSTTVSTTKYERYLLNQGFRASLELRLGQLEWLSQGLYLTPE